MPADNPAPPLECPVCGQPLTRASGALTCPARHSFDVAREGYVNLLPAQHKSRGIEGDTAEMIQARRRFLEAGHYAPLSEALAEATRRAVAESAHAKSRQPVLLEVGCGEGYYLGAVASSLRFGGVGITALGSDLSKAAVRAAARRYPDELFFVADTHRRLYVLDASITVLLDVFAPRNASEFERVIEPGGSAIIVVPSPKHMASARDELGLLGIEEDKEQRVLDALDGGFELRERTPIAFEMSLDAPAAADLVAMGPNRWHGHEAGGGALVTEASFVMLELRRRRGA